MNKEELLVEILNRLINLEKEVKKQKKKVRLKKNKHKITESDGCTRIKSMGDDDGCIGYKEGLAGWQ
jgi:hypothetical protein